MLNRCESPPPHTEVRVRIDRYLTDSHGGRTALPLLSSNAVRLAASYYTVLHARGPAAGVSGMTRIAVA